MAQENRKIVHDLAEEARKLLEKADEEPDSKFSKLKWCIPEKTFIYIPKTPKGAAEKSGKWLQNTDPPN